MLDAGQPEARRGLPRTRAPLGGAPSPYAPSRFSRARITWRRRRARRKACELAPLDRRDLHARFDASLVVHILQSIKDRALLLTGRLGRVAVIRDLRVGGPLLDGCLGDALLHQHLAERVVR